MSQRIIKNLSRSISMSLSLMRLTMRITINFKATQRLAFYTIKQELLRSTGSSMQTYTGEHSTTAVLIPQRQASTSRKLLCLSHHMPQQRLQLSFSLTTKSRLFLTWRSSPGDPLSSSLTSIDQRHLAHIQTLTWTFAVSRICRSEILPSQSTKWAALLPSAPSLSGWRPLQLTPSLSL